MIFINYRQSDAEFAVSTLYYGLRQFFKGHVFIALRRDWKGMDYERRLFSDINRCRIVLCLIGEGWLEAADERGHRRLDQTSDLVRREIEFAINSRKTVIPVLLNHARMPSTDHLPPSISKLTAADALLLRLESFLVDIDVIQAKLRMALRSSPTELTTPSYAEPLNLLATTTARPHWHERIESSATRDQVEPNTLVQNRLAAPLAPRRNRLFDDMTFMPPNALRDRLKGQD